MQLLVVIAYHAFFFFVSYSIARTGVALAINIIVPIEDSTKTLQYFEEFNLGEDIQFNIAGTGDFECIFRGISPMIDKNSYSSFSITVQEKEPQDNVNS